MKNLGQIEEENSTVERRQFDWDRQPAKQIWSREPQGTELDGGGFRMKSQENYQDTTPTHACSQVYYENAWSEKKAVRLMYD